MIRFVAIFFIVFNNYQAFSINWEKELKNELERLSMPQIQAKQKKQSKIKNIEKINLQDGSFETLPLASDNNNLELLFQDQKLFKKL